MTKRHLTAPARSVKPKKPSKDFPLFPHAVGQWAKKIRGKMHYFGVWADPDAALVKWIAEKDELLAGLVPRCRTGVANGPTLRDLVNKFLTTKAMLRDNGELSPHTWKAYHAICEWLTATFGKDRLLTDLLPEDFERLRAKWAETWGPVRLKAEIVRTRVVFNYAYENGLIDRPMRYGEGFQPPKKKTMRINRAEQGLKMFEADELRRMIDAAKQPLKSMLLLAINAGMGNHDVAKLPIAKLDLDGGWMNFGRPKTGVERHSPLWPETIKALREWLKVRPAAKDEVNAGLVFITRHGNAWFTERVAQVDDGEIVKAIVVVDDPVSKEASKLLKTLGINGHRGFYAARHTFATIAGGSLDQVAVNAIMGHDPDSMESVYRERIGETQKSGDERLQAVTDHVRRWLFGQ